MDYLVVFKRDLGEFQIEVSKLIKSGWVLQGGVSLSVSESDEYRYIYYAQALIKVKQPRTGITKA